MAIQMNLMLTISCNAKARRHPFENRLTTLPPRGIMCTPWTQTTALRSSLQDVPKVEGRRLDPWDIFCLNTSVGSGSQSVHTGHTDDVAVVVAKNINHKSVYPPTNIDGRILFVPYMESMS